MLSRRPQLSRGAFRERVRAHPRELLVGGAELFACILSRTLGARLFAVEESTAGEQRPRARPPELFDRLAVVPLGLGPVGHQRLRNGRQAEAPSGAAR